MRRGSSRRDRRWIRRALGACLAAPHPAPGRSVQPEPPPPPPDTTTVQEMPAPVAGPQPPIVSPEPPKPEEPERVRESVSGIPLTTLETDNQLLLYFDPTQTYLTPYVARAFENSIEWHKQRFQWEPWDRTTVLIKDFGDYGNASARASPNNGVTLDVAPLSQRMETFSPGERFFTLINHELAHVATLDVYNRKDAAGANGWAASRCRSRSIRNRSSTII